MKLINRGYLLAKPKKTFIDWALEINPELMIDEDSEGSLYLIEEEFWDDALLIGKYAKKILQQECNAIFAEQKDIPILPNPEKIDDFFQFELGCTVIDLLNDTITTEEI